MGVSLILTAALLTFAYYARPRRRSDISFRDAFVIGIAQAFAAVLPGLSPSGSTIATGLLLGDRKEDVAEALSFLMVLIPILGEAFLDALKGGFAPAESGISAAALTGGTHRRFRLGLSGLQLDDRSGQAREIDLFRRVLFGGGNRLDPLFSDLKR